MSFPDHSERVAKRINVIADRINVWVQLSGHVQWPARPESVASTAMVFIVITSPIPVYSALPAASPDPNRATQRSSGPAHSHSPPMYSSQPSAPRPLDAASVNPPARSPPRPHDQVQHSAPFRSTDFTSPFKDCLEAFGTLPFPRYSRPPNGQINGYVKFNWTGESARGSSSGSGTPKPRFYPPLPSPDQMQSSGSIRTSAYGLTGVLPGIAVHGALTHLPNFTKHCIQRLLAAVDQVDKIKINQISEFNDLVKIHWINRVN
ncbi:hypothetical protein B0I35DRAFT_478071 [Stachybotrys elegans]|uniref:Uncharacterized protein n=1 Tax=Stachybotrys elegans TaxID=80388 RepID=A0A8K0SVT5_9HYPO|nr:hypothetical protein B0I35DRAFT_478071 [Stachybotrys elegans]